MTVIDSASISEISDEYALEMSREEYLKRTAPPQQAAHAAHHHHVPNTKAGVALRLSNLMKNRRRTLSSEDRSPARRRGSHTHDRSPARRRGSHANLGGDSEHATTQSQQGSLEGVQSLSLTVESHDTVKASNTTAKPASGSKKKGGWTKLKRMIGVKTAPDDTIKQSLSYEGPASPKDRSFTLKSHNISKPKRVRSLTMSNCGTPGTEQQEVLDHSIRGRLDGIDVLPLGSFQSVSKILHPDYPPSGSDLPSFIGESFLISPAQIVANMLHYSGGRNPPEMVLDGFLPGVDDRWTVRMEGCLENSSVCSSSTKATEASEDGGSPPLVTPKLWNTLWGPDPAPANLTDLDLCGADDPVLVLAAECSVPIDVDEDTFMISTREHLHAIHEIAASPLSKGNFTLALGIFQKLLKGLDLANQYPFIKGAVLHNIGIIHQWQGDYQKALFHFNRAVNERVQFLPKNHPDTIVSMVRKGLSLFALERFDEAVSVLETALPLVPKDHLVKAKIRNNLGVVYYHQRNFVAALKEFTKSLETQRSWLDTSIRREPMVFDAATTLSNMGRLYVEREDYDLACQVYEESLLLLTTIMRQDAAAVIATLINIALCAAKNNNTKKALQILQGCVRSRNGRFGVGSAPSIEVIGIMGYLYLKQDCSTDAMKCFNQVRKWQKVNLPATHPSVVKTKGMLKSLEDQIGNESTIWI